MRTTLGSVPAGYVVHRIGSTWLVLDHKLSADLVKLGLAEPSVRQALFARAAPGGRGHTPIVEVNGETRLILRRYRHGGLFGSFTRTLFLGPDRALQELEVTVRAEAAGAPVPHPLLLSAWPVAGPFWSAMIGTRLESQAKDLLEVLREARDPEARRRLLSSN